MQKISKCFRIAILKCVLGVDGGGASCGGDVVVVLMVAVVVVVVVVVYWWWRSGGGGAGDSPCKVGSCNRCRSAITKVV